MLFHCDANSSFHPHILHSFSTLIKHQLSIGEWAVSVYFRITSYKLHPPRFHWTSASINRSRCFFWQLFIGWLDQQALVYVQYGRLYNSYHWCDAATPLQTLIRGHAKLRPIDYRAWSKHEEYHISLVHMHSLIPNSEYLKQCTIQEPFMRTDAVAASMVFMFKSNVLVIVRGIYLRPTGVGPKQKSRPCV